MGQSSSVVQLLTPVRPTNLRGVAIGNSTGVDIKVVPVDKSISQFTIANGYWLVIPVEMMLNGITLDSKFNLLGLPPHTEFASDPNNPIYLRGILNSWKVPIGTSYYFVIDLDCPPPPMDYCTQLNIYPETATGRWHASTDQAQLTKAGPVTQGTIWYRSSWFWLIVALVVIALIIYYRKRGQSSTVCR